MLISGVKYHRSKAKLGRDKLASFAGISRGTLWNMEASCELPDISSVLYMRLAEALHVSVEELLTPHDDSELEDGDKTAYPSKTENLKNPIAVYRKQHGLTVAQLGERLGGKSKEWGRQACASEHPSEKQIEALAACEGITPEEFLRLYAPGEAA